MKHKVRYSLLAFAAATLGMLSYAGDSANWLEVSGGSAEIKTFGTRHICIFTDTSSPATLMLKQQMTLEEYLVVGGGGAGGNSISGGGGGGGVVHSNVPQQVAADTVITVSVGAGGLPSSGTYTSGKQGGHSSFTLNGVTVAGFGGTGGGGYSEAVLAAEEAGKVGSGGGTARNYSIGTDGSQWNSAQGHKGFQAAYEDIGGGGGGAGKEAELDYGGEGLKFAISGEYVVYGSGGGAGLRTVATIGFGGKGGTNGGRGGVSSAILATAGVDGTGGGGGGGGHDGTTARKGANGGSGTVVLVFSEVASPVARFAVAPIEDQLFVSSAVRPDVTVTNAAGDVLSPTDYTVTYVNNTGAGKAVAIVQGAENTPYAGYTAICPFSIHAVAYEDESIIASDASVRKVVDGSRLVYIFTNVNKTVVFRTKRMLSRENLLLVGGGGSGGGIYGGGGGGGGYVADKTMMLFDAADEVCLQVGAGADAHPAKGNHGAFGRIGGHTWINFGTGRIYAYGGGGGGGYNNKPAPLAEVYNEIGSGGGDDDKGSVGYRWNADQGNAGAPRYGGNSRGGGGGALRAAVIETGKGTPGGEGITNNITGVDEVYGSGGGGCPATACPIGTGGTNAGDGHPQGATECGGNGVDGTGAGGGGGASGNYGSGGKGGSGTVIISFLDGDHINYRDNLILTPDPTARRIDLPHGTVYVFTNVTDEAIQVKALRRFRIVDALVVGGGGAGGTAIGGGGGGGGVVYSNNVSYTVEKDSSISLKVGAGGTGVPSTSAVRYIAGLQGELSSLSYGDDALVAYGGGGGAGYSTLPSAATNPGQIGSGGGSSYSGSGTEGTQWKQGFQGGGSTSNNGGGGGGASHAGYNSAGGFAGGEGLTYAITGTDVVYGSGGGGGSRSGSTTTTPGLGGTNAGAGGSNSDGFPGVDGTGGGGGGSGYFYNGSLIIYTGGRGGSGTVILTVRQPRGLAVIVR